jgi:hypothetical protein
MVKFQPSDLVQQSIPFAYMAVSAASTDEASHSVQVYSVSNGSSLAARFQADSREQHISAKWASGDRSLTVNWNSKTSGSILTHQFQLASPSVFAENSDQTQCQFKNLL